MIKAVHMYCRHTVLQHPKFSSPCYGKSNVLRAQVGCRKITQSSGKGGNNYIYSYEGTFTTRDGALFVLPPATRRSMTPRPSREIETRMLRVRYKTNLDPRADPGVASWFVILSARSSLVREAR